MATYPMNAKMVKARLVSADVRMKDYLAQNGGQLTHHNCDPYLRDRTVQEFFFHLVGSIDFCAQHVNQRRPEAGVHYEGVTARALLKAGALHKVFTSIFKELTADTGYKKPVPQDWYSKEGVIYRIYNFRNQVTHRGINPLVSGGGGIRLYIDPRPDRKEVYKYSKHTVFEELPMMYAHVETRVMKLLTMV
jgi:hypothetical protein